MSDATVSLVIAGLSAVVSVASLGYTTHVARRDSALQRRVEREALAFRYREPLLRAAYELAARCYNIGAQGFLQTYLVKGSANEREYAMESTLFTVAQYFAWVEIVRRTVQYLDPTDPRREAELVELMDEVRNRFSTDHIDERVGRLFRAQQRALGEMLMQRDEHGDQWTCMGYAEFH